MAHQEQRVQGVVIVEHGPKHLLQVPHLLDQSVQSLGHAAHLDHPIVHILLVTISREGVILVDYITPEVLEIETKAGHKLIDDVAIEDHGQIQRDDPQCGDQDINDLLCFRVTVEQGDVDIRDDESNQEGDSPYGKHIKGNFLGVCADSVSIEDHILSQACQTVDTGPAQS